MKTQSEGKNRGTFAMLDNVAPNLFRHSGNQSYWGVKKMNGKRTVRALETVDRKTADGKLSEWLADLKKVDPGNRDMTLAMLLKKYEAARTDIAHSTQVGEQGRIAKFRELFPSRWKPSWPGSTTRTSRHGSASSARGSGLNSQSIPGLRTRPLRFRGVRHGDREKPLRSQDHSQSEEGTGPSRQRAAAS